MNFWQFAHLHPVAATLMVLFVVGGLTDVVGAVRKFGRGPFPEGEKHERH